MKSIIFHRNRLAVIGLLWALLQSATAQNFQMTLEPATLTNIPNQEVSLLVSMTPLNGFTNQVALAVGTLPSGVTAQFSPQTLTPPGTSVLSLRAAANAALGSFTLNITASGGGITNTTSSSVTVSFGVLPICTGAFNGRVTDANTGLPVPDARVVVNSYYSAQADTNGMYTITGVGLGNNNSVTLCDLDASAPGYWVSPSVSGYAVCDATNTVNLQLVFEEYGSLSGSVSIQGGGPATGVVVSLNNGKSAFTDSNGNYQFTNLALAYPNAPNAYAVNCHPANYWLSASNGTVRANSNTVVDLVLVPICHGTVTGSVFYGDTRLPATNAAVSVVDSQSYGVGANTDANGNYAITNVSLDVNGTLRSFVDASAPGYNSAGMTVTITNCGATATAPAIYLSPVPRDNYGSVTGHVNDAQTGLPIAQAKIFYNGSIGFTDTNGAYLCTNIYVGSGAVTDLSINGDASLAGIYFTVVSNTVVYAGQTTTQDFRMLRVGYGGVMGNVRDSATTLPLTNVVVAIASSGSGGITAYSTTDVNGHYFSGPLALISPNAPTPATVSAAPPAGYYYNHTNTTITLGVTNVVDLPLLKICTGATIIGNVVNALTQQPITHATLNVIGDIYPAYTDTNGNFILTNVTVGNDNSPIQVTVNVSAPGFIPQSKTVTIFCDATIITDFGAPQTAVGVIEGLVTNVVTGLPLAGVFIGSQFGESTLTDSNGLYQLTGAPLGANNSSRTWNVTATPPNFPAQTLPVTVSSNAVAILNFGFGQPPAQLQVTGSATPNPVTVGSNLVYTITLSNNAAAAANVQLTDQLAPAFTFFNASITNSPGGAFTAPVFSNGVVATTATNLASGESLILVVTGSPTLAGTLTNTATVTSSTPDIDPTGASRTVTLINSAVAPAALHADLGLAVTALPNPVVASNALTYSISVTNAGPADAPDVIVNDMLPANTVFVSANASQGSFTQNGSVLQWDLGAITNSGNASVSLVVTPLVAGLVTNTATVAIGPGGGAVTDTNLVNNIASVVTTVSAPVVVPAFGVIQGYVTNALTGLPLAGASIGSQFGGTAATDANGFYQLTQAPLGANNSSRAWNITASPANFPAQTRSVTVSFNTVSTLNFGFSPPPTQLQVTGSSTPSPVTVGSNLVYTITLFNNAAGAANVQLSDQLAPAFSFLSASITNPPGGAFTAPVFTNGVVTTMATNLGSGASLVLVVTGSPAAPGNLTNIATATSSTPDVDPTGADRTAILVNNAVAMVIVPVVTNVSVQAVGGPVFNPQTGLFQQSVQFNNLNAATVAAVRLFVLDLPANVALYNASGSTNGLPYVEYHLPVAPGDAVNFVLEYYSASRGAFVMTNFAATAVTAAQSAAPAGAMLQLDQTPSLHDGQVLIEFASIPGATYVIQYSNDTQTWVSAVPPVVAAGTRVQWIDSGPPKTGSAPASVGSRYYRVRQTGGSQTNLP